MATDKRRDGAGDRATQANVSSSVEELLVAAMERNDDSLRTGRYLLTMKEGAGETAMKASALRGLRMADARDLGDTPSLEAAGDAEGLLLPEIGVAVVSGAAAAERELSVQADVEPDADDPVASVDPEYFMFPTAAMETLDDVLGAVSDGNGHGGPRFELSRIGDLLPPVAREVGSAEQAARSMYLRGFMRAAEALVKDVQVESAVEAEEVQPVALGATWGLIACRVPNSTRNGLGIKVAVLDTGFDLGHPDFVGRPIAHATFVGQPVQDLNGHGTHCTGTACGPQSPPGTTPRYGIAFRSSIHIGKVLSNSGGGTQASVLAGMNWAIARRCQVISMSLGAPIGVQPSYTAAGQAALNHGLLIIAAAGNGGGSPTGAPANSPTIMAVASLDRNLHPSIFSDVGKIEISAPGRDVFSSWFRPLRYNTISGTSMATPHVAGCAALWAQRSPSFRGAVLRRVLMATARRLPFPLSRVGAGLVQAPA
jgi:subtilisin family serine protease